MDLRALSVALLIGGLTAPWLGGLLDHIGAGRVMTIGSAAAAAALVACAYATAAATIGALAIVTFGFIATIQRAYRSSPISG